MINVAALERDLDAKRTEGQALVKRIGEKAEAENRLLTDEERTEITAVTTQARDLQEKIARAKGDDAMLTEIARLTSGVSPLPARGTSRRILTLGEQFVRAPEFEFFKKGGHRASSAWRSPGFELLPPAMQAATLTEDPASGGALVIPQQIASLQAPPTGPLLVADLFAQGTTSSNAVSYMREKTFTNAADTVLEGAAKPESTLTFEAATDPVRKIAHWLPVTEEMLEDVPQIQSYIDARLRVGVQTVEDDQLLNGTGTAPDLLGLRNRAGLAPDVVLKVGEPNADAMLRQTLAIYGSSFLMPDGYVMNPADWASTLLSKTNAGEYFTGGPFSPIQGASLWGLPVAVTPTIPATIGLVGAFKTGAQIFRRGGIRVEASNSHQDFFVKNLVAIRAEERLALAVYRPGAFGEVTGLSGPGA